MVVSAFGMQLHAAATVDGRDRRRLERRCRYLLRPAFAHGAVQRMPDGQVRVHFKKPNRRGATFTQMSPETFLAHSARRLRRWIRRSPGAATDEDSSCYVEMVTALVDRARLLLQEHEGVIVAYVFGSVGRGGEGPRSDVDIAVLFREPPVSSALVPIRRALERGLGREIDLVDLHRAPADLVHRVLRDGVVVVERDRHARVEFEVRRRNEYFDLLPVLQRYRRQAS